LNLLLYLPLSEVVIFQSESFGSQASNNCVLCIGQQLSYCVYLVALFHCLVICRQCVCVFVLWTNKWWWNKLGEWGEWV